jgi:hypothetical protein
MRAVFPPGPASAVTEKPHLSRDMLSEERVRAATRACAYSHSDTETHAAGKDLNAFGDGLVSSPNDAGWAMHAKML